MNLKMKMGDAKKMEREGFTIMHIEWFTKESGYSIIHHIDLKEKNPDCSHVLIAPNKRWTDYNSVSSLILSN